MLDVFREGFDGRVVRHEGPEERVEFLTSGWRLSHGVFPTPQPVGSFPTPAPVGVCLQRYPVLMDPGRARQLLMLERERIEQAVAGLGDEDRETASEQSEPGDRGSENLYQKEFDAGLAEDLADQLAALQRAEARLAAGTYGLSTDSGEPIPDERLEALPTAELTVEEQQLRERG
jgi:DnaK suppressor protein